MNRCRRSAASAFTLVEMIVVISIMILVMGGLMSGLVTAQKRSDNYSTTAVLQAVHEACYRNARQFGSADIVYGFSLPFSSDLATTVRPWVQIGSAGTYYQGDTYAGMNIDFKGDIGRERLWTAASNAITFEDYLRPGKHFSLDGGPKSSASSTQLNVHYEPRTGFIHVNTGTPYQASVLTNPAAAWATPLKPNSLDIEIWNARVSPGSQQTTFVLSATGALDVRAK